MQINQRKLVPLLLVNKFLIGLLILISISIPLMAEEYRSEIDGFSIQLPQRLYPVALSYDQNTQLGQVRVKSLSFHSEIGKFLVEIADYPATDQRSAINRIESKIQQLHRNPNRRFDLIEQFLSESAPGALVKSFDGVHSDIHAIFVSGQREYHLSSESFEINDLTNMLAQTELMIRSFRLTEPTLVD